MTYHVLIPDNVHPAALEVLREAQGITFDAPGKLSRADLLEQVKQAHALIIRSGVRVDAEVFEAAPRLKCVARAGVGVDNVDLEEATRRGVIVMNTPGGNTTATVEYTLALMLALARHIPQAHASLEAGRWDRKAFMGTELRGKTLGIVGFGRIGSGVARRARAFEMRVVAYDPFCDGRMTARAAEIGVEMTDLETLFADSDFISLHAALTESSRGMINRQSLARMKKGVRIINAARGALIVEDDLAEAIREGHVAGAALDVYSEEPPPADHPLIGLPGVIHTPHLAASTAEAQVAVAVEAARLIVNALLQGETRNVVNPDVLSGEF